jgi:hypothetical protein
VSVLEVVHALSFFGDGFQWIDGSFVKKGKGLKDIDVVAFFRRPPNATTAAALLQHRQATDP